MSLEVTHDDHTHALVLRLNRPEKRNAIDDETMLELIAAVEDAGTDESVRVIVLEGAGGHFCSGADIVARNAPSAGGGADPKPRTGSIQRRLPTQAHRLIPLLCTVQVPVVCKVQGWAAGIGFQIALAADITMAADDARFWEPFGERGFTPDSGATWLLPRRVGEVRARELLLLGRAISGREAADWGAIHRAVTEEELDAAVDDVVATLAAGPTVALGLTKWLLHAGATAELPAQLANEAFALELSSRTEDFREGMAAFREKRPPRFEGR
ncbi:MAG: 2-(1,2-epoxy,2-dihydrophenyl)acetyl-CoA isomerase [Actinomycetota bacterium]|jgi:2-(1,2-epoxy-1,2-dihydrophenyl)acetyl-CoA isomerase|nr:2-(1,2-epoxy,2-dihydrophenyl)acetyl-CoA isomerase [Actinomycetota bacterium]